MTTLPRAHRRPAVLAALLLLLAAALACNLPGGFGPTPTPTPLAGYLGAFDCNGLEGGLYAYTGRLTFAAQPDATFKAEGSSAVNGTYDFDAVTNVYTFRAGFVFDGAVYDPGTDALVATVAPGIELAHADGGSVNCVRAQPGITGP